MNENYTVDDFLAEISKNLADEAKAIEGYFKLIKNCPDKYEKYIPDLAEIIADEKNHMGVLEKISLEIDDIKPKKD